MPFKSVKQEKWAFATKQPFAQKWAGLTNQSNLPNSAQTPTTKSSPTIAMTSSMITAIKSSRKGKIPPGLARYLANKKKGGK